MSSSFDDEREALHRLRVISGIGNEHPLAFLADLAIQANAGHHDVQFEHCFEAYIRKFAHFSNSAIEYAYKTTRYRRPDAHEINVELGNSMELSASIQSHRSYFANIDLSLGCLLALYDVCMRATSAQDFLNADLQKRTKGNDFWPGNYTIEHDVNTMFQVQHRYFDYNLKLGSGNTNQINNNVSLPFVRKFPIDLGRVMLAERLFLDATRWIFLHEESHYRLGHLDFLRSVGREKADTRIQLSEYRLEIGSGDVMDTRPIVEWQADRAASQICADLTLWNEPLFAEMFPSYLQLKEMWQVRYLLVSMGVSSIVLDEGRFHNGQPTNYPTVKARLCTMMTSALTRMLAPEYEGEVTVRGPDGSLDIEKLITFVQRVSEAFMDLETVYALVRSDDGRDDFDLEPLLLDRDHAFLIGIIYTYTTLKKIAVGEKAKAYLERLMSVHLETLDINLEAIDILEYKQDIYTTLDEHNLLHDLDKEKYWEFFRTYREFCEP